MNKQSRDFKPFQLRSVGAIIHDGYLLYMDQFRRIFRGTWLAALCYALVTGVGSSMLMQTLSQIFFLRSMHMNQEILSRVLFMSGNALVMILVGAFLYASGFSLLITHQSEGALPATYRWYGYMKRKGVVRTLVALLCLLLYVLLSVLFTVIFFVYLRQHLSSIAYHVLAALVLLGFALLTPPLLFLLVRYILSEKSRPWAQPLPSRYWGSTMLVALVVVIITSLMSLVAELPTNILTMANLQSQLGSLRGDPVGMPDYMAWLNIIAFTLAAFINAYVLLSAIFPFYYLNGSIEAQEKEREELAQRFKNL